MQPVMVRRLLGMGLLAGVLGAPAGCSNGTSDEVVATEAAALIEWIAAHPDQASVLVTGGTDPSDELAWRAEAERPLASTFKVVVLAAYAREVASGRLDPEERVPRAALERWYFAGTDGGAHEGAMAAMSVRAGDTLSLDQVTRAMIEFSDNAATDYVLERLGRLRVLDAARALDLAALGAGVAPVAGVLLTLADEELGASVGERLRALGALTVEERSTRAWSSAARYAGAPDASLAGLASALREVTGWTEQLALSDAMPFRGSARDMASLIEETRNGTRLGSDAAELAARHLSWPMKDPASSARFGALGAKDGETAGVLTIAGFARPSSGRWRGVDRIVVLQLEGMDPESWQSARETYFLLAADLADRPDVVDALRDRLSG
jgi:hypothetical protein